MTPQGYGVGQFALASAPSSSHLQFSNPIFYWKDVEPSEGSFVYTAIDAAIAAATGAGKRAIPRIVTYWGTGAEVTPSWVFTAGATSWVPEGGGIRAPIPWDAIYKAKFTALLTALGARYDGNDGIEFWQIISGGIYGELYYGPHNPTGYSVTNHRNAAYWHIEAFRNAFPNTNLSVAVNSLGNNLAADVCDHAIVYDYILQTNAIHPGTEVINDFIARDTLPTRICIEAEDFTGLGSHNNATDFTTQMNYLFGRGFSIDYVTLNSADVSGSNTASLVDTEVYDNLRQVSYGPDIASITPSAFSEGETGVEIVGDSFSTANANILADGGFDSGEAGNANGAGTTTSHVNLDHRHNGLWSVKAITPGSSINEGIINASSSDGDVTPGSGYTGSVWVYHESGSAKNLRVNISWRAAGGSLLSETNGSAISVPSGVWTKLTCSGTAPASASRAYIKAITALSAQAITFWADEFKLETGSIATGNLVEIGDNQFYGSCSVLVSQTIEDQDSTTIHVTIDDIDGLTLGSLYLFVTDQDGNHSIGSAITLNASGELTGTQPAPSGNLVALPILDVSVSLAGNQPASSGGLVASALATQWTTWASILRQIDPSGWVGTIAFYLEVQGKTSDSGYNISARLYNVTLDSYVVGSLVSGNQTSEGRMRSGSFSLDAGNNEYRIEFGGFVGATYTLYDATLIVEVTP